MPPLNRRPAGLAPRGLPGLDPTALLVVVVALLGCVFLYLVGIDALEGRSSLQFFADSGSYHAVARGDVPGRDEAVDLIGITSNYLGPSAVLWLAGQNYYAVLAINSLLFYASIVSLSRTLRLDSLRFTGLLLIDPMTLSSVVSVNKEIISLVFLALLVRVLTVRSVLSTLAAGAMSMLVRWQLCAFYVVLLSLASPANILRRNRWLSFALVLVGLSIMYDQLASVFEEIQAVFEMSAAEYEGSGLFELLVNWQDRFGYWLVFPLKALHLLFALGLRFDRLLKPVDIYNDVVVMVHSSMTLVLFVSLWSRRLFRIQNDLIYISLLYLAVFAISPIYAPRYMYPVYVLWAAALSARTSSPGLLSGPSAPMVRRRIAVGAEETAVRADMLAGSPEGRRLTR